MAFFDNPAERAHDVGFKVEVHRQVGFVPVAQHAQADEILALTVDLLRGVLAAFLAEGFGVDLDAGLADFLFHLQFNRQAVAIPARHIARVVTVQRAAFDDDVFQNLVDRMADMNVAVGVRRAVVQHKGWAALTGFADFLIQTVLPPLLQHLRFALGEVAAHRKIGVGQVKRGFVVGHGVLGSE